MTCHYCRSVNADEDHRCRRCGRRLAGSAVEAPPEYAERALQNVGANALAAAAATAEMPRTEVLAPARNTIQSSLFVQDNVLPFNRPVESEPAARKELPETAELFPSKPAAKPRPIPRKTPVDSAQSTLDFLPPKQHTARLLKTSVEAAIRCDVLPASPMHRAGAAAIDVGLIGASCVLFFAICRIFGGSIPMNKQTLLIFGGLCVLIGVFYGFIWMLADRETLGMYWADLRIVSFSGFPPDRKTRALRMMGCFLSFCSGMIGIFWALLDEEGLTWHDHMSKTFPTLRDTGSHLIRH